MAAVPEEQSSAGREDVRMDGKHEEMHQVQQ